VRLCAGNRIRPRPLLAHCAISLERKIRSRSVNLGHGSRGVTLVSWNQRFFDPFKLPGRKPLVTLRDAAEYIMELPEAEHGLLAACVRAVGLRPRRCKGRCTMMPYRSLRGCGQGGARGGVMRSMST
jgi:hypothetical protein